MGGKHSRRPPKGTAVAARNDARVGDEARQLAAEAAHLRHAGGFVWYKRRPSHEHSDTDVEARVLGAREDRVLIDARWTKPRGGIGANILMVSEAYWLERYA